MGPVSNVLGEFVARLRLADLPLAVRERAMTALLDTTGVIYGAALLEEAVPALSYVEELGGRPEAHVVGIAEPVSARTAAYGNAWLADVLDYEDTHKVGGNHPGATVVPAAVAIGQRQGASGADLLTAIVAGYEVANRLAQAVAPQQFLRGFLSTGTCGTLGAAAAAGHLLRLDEETLSQALRIAGFLLPISAADTLWEGESAKPGHAAQAAATGVEAALLAARGFTAAPLEGGRRKLGYLHMVSNEIDVAGIHEGLGEAFTLDSCAIKPYPCCGYTHGGIDAALQLRGPLNGRTARISSVRVQTYRLPLLAVGSRYTDPTSTFTACQFSLPYAIAAALLDGQVGVAQFTSARRADPAIHDLARRVVVTEDPLLTARYPHSFPFRIEVTVDGDRLTASVEHPLGTSGQPMSDEQVRMKFLALTEPALGPAGARDLAGSIGRLDQLPSFTWPAIAPDGSRRPTV